MSYVTVKITIESVTPILFNRFTEESEVAVSSGSRPSTKGEYGTPREQAEKTRYCDDKGNLYYPAANVFAAIIDAGRFHKIGKRQITTGKTSLVPAGLTIPELILPFNTKEFEVDSRRIVIPANNASVMRHRARLDKWELTFHLEIDTTIFDQKTVRLLVDDAGKKSGLGDYRPNRRGPFGKFVVKHWTEVAPKPEKKSKAA